MAKKRSAAQKAAFKKMIAGLDKWRKKKGVKSNPKKRKTKKRVVKRKVAKTVKRKVAKTVKRKRPTVKRNVSYATNPLKYYIMQGKTSYFDGSGFTRSKASAAFYSSKKKALSIARKLAEAINKPVALHVSGGKKKG